MRKRKPSEDVRIERLEKELWVTRHIVLNLMTEEARKILQSYYRCDPSEEGEMWLSDIVASVMELAKPLSTNPDSSLSNRARCPLCGSESSAPYAIGFTMEGLRRHLTGWGNVHECGIMMVARKLAMEHWAEAKKRRLVKQRNKGF